MRKYLSGWVSCPTGYGRRGNKVTGALVALALLIAAGTAGAAEMRGMLEAVDQAAGTVTVDGITYQAPQGVNLEAYPVGDRVVVVYEERDGQRVATAVRKADH
jgi:hypothetical protein